MKKGIINLIVFFIPIPKYRKLARFYLNNFSLIAISDYNKFKSTPIKQNSVLLFEQNDCHGEVSIGLSKYLIELGYNVDIIFVQQVFNQKPMSGLSLLKKCFDIHRLSPIFFKKLFKLPKINDYSALIFTSSKYYSNHTTNNFILNYIDYKPTTKMKILYTLHDSSDIEEAQLFDLLQKNQIISLGSFTQGVMVNPHYFCDIKLLPKNKITTFIIVGSLNPNRKNHALLFQTIKKLILEKFDFRVIVIGDGKISNIPEFEDKYVTFKGRLDFPDMYQEIISSDFILPLLDPLNKEQNRYVTTGVTGSAQLAYGFIKPCVIHKKFASFYNFTTLNSIIYEESLYLAMREAIMMDKAQYSFLQKNLQETANNIYNMSKDNLKKLLN